MVSGTLKIRTFDKSFAKVSGCLNWVSRVEYAFAKYPQFHQRHQLNINNPIHVD